VRSVHPVFSTDTFLYVEDADRHSQISLVVGGGLPAPDRLGRQCQVGLETRSLCLLNGTLAPKLLYVLPADLQWTR
jgi:hypothetical protein